MHKDPPTQMSDLLGKRAVLFGCEAWLLSASTVLQSCRKCVDFAGSLLLCQAWKHGLYEYLSSVQTLPAGDSFASLAHTQFMQANDSMPGRPVDHPELRKTCSSSSEHLSLRP